jgi:hypothetical protein
MSPKSIQWAYRKEEIPVQWLGRMARFDLAKVRLAMQGANNRTLMALGGWKSPAMLSRYAHLSPAHLWKAVKGLTQVGTVTKAVTEEWAGNEETQKLFKDVVSRLGLEPRTLALKARKGQ